MKKITIFFMIIIVLFLTACSNKAENAGSITLDSQLKEAIQDYLSMQDDVNTPSFGGKNFVSISALGLENTNQTQMKVYVWGVSRNFTCKTATCRKVRQAPYLLPFRWKIREAITGSLATKYRKMETIMVPV